jgi:hypothetical protein
LWEILIILFYLIKTKPIIYQYQANILFPKKKIKSSQYNNILNQYIFIFLWIYNKECEMTVAKNKYAMTLIRKSKDDSK